MKETASQPLSAALFQNPTSEYRGAPFWAWNGRADDHALMQQQIDTFQAMGFGGFHIHARIGLSSEYMGKDFMESVKFCHEYAQRKDMLTYLYDEDKWPSGYGAGRVTGDPKNRARYLLLSPNFYENGHLDRHLKPSNRLTENGDATLLRRYQICLRDGCLASYRTLTDTESADAQTWYAYLVVTDPLPWFNNAAYSDNLDPQTVQHFTEVAYEPYKKLLGEEFSKSVPSIFTDEPQFVRVQTLSDGAAREEVGIPYTERLGEAFQSVCGQPLLDCLPEIFWTRADGAPSTIKYRYFDLLSEQFSSAYAGTLGKWCAENHLKLTGHVMQEESLESQTRCVGEAMRTYPYFQLPGIDILADRYEYTTAKQAQSVAHQIGCVGITSELYGVTNWDFDFRGHKLQGDWQAALGVTQRVPHLAWMYMGGESKRDYPAPIDAHSPWYGRYRLIEDYFARLNTALRRGRPVVQLAVIHPIESMWMAFGPDRQTAAGRADLERQFQTLTETLLFNQIDFDFLSESVLTRLSCDCRDETLCVGRMQYRAVLVPPLTTIRSTTLDLLERFRKQGGHVFLCGKAPACVDGAPSERAAEFFSGCTGIPNMDDALIPALEPFRQIEVFGCDDLRAKDLIYQLREDGAGRWLFLAHGRKDASIESNPFLKQQRQEKHRLVLRGRWKPQQYNAMDGSIHTPDFRIDGERTVVDFDLFAHDSLLLHLEPAEAGSFHAQAEAQTVQTLRHLTQPVPFRLEEPNVLLLDQAEYALDGGPWQAKEELLRIDTLARGQFGYRKRTDSFPQPWLTGARNEKAHTIDLRFTVRSAAAFDHAALAFEGDADVQITWNGQAVTTAPNGYYVDPAIHRVELGALNAGENHLELHIPFGENTALEWCYLLGEFGVRVFGSTTLLEALPEKIGFGDYAAQDLPFYGGNLCYQMAFETPACQAVLEIPEYAAPLLGIEIDGGPEQPLFAAPYQLPLGTLTAGTHHVTLRCYGSRINTFGQLHNCNRRERYFGPLTWRTDAERWSYEYQLHACGVLTAPILKILR